MKDSDARGVPWPFYSQYSQCRTRKKSLLYQVISFFTFAFFFVLSCRLKMQDHSFSQQSSQVILIPPLTSDSKSNGVENGGFMGRSEPENADGIHNSWSDEEWMLEQSREETVTTGGFSSNSIKAKIKHGCTLAAWRRRLPITYWLPKYNLRDFRGDMVAGLTVGMNCKIKHTVSIRRKKIPTVFFDWKRFDGGAAGTSICSHCASPVRGTVLSNIITVSAEINTPGA